MTTKLCLAAALVAALGASARADEATETQQEAAPQPKRGDFDAGGKVRFPSGPDEMGQFGQFNWVAVDATGRYFLLDQLTITGTLPLAPIHQDFGGAETSIFGGFTVRPELALDKALGIGVTLGLLRDGAFLLSDRDFPLYVGDLKFGAALGPWIKFKGLGLEFTTVPQVIYQATDDTLLAVQLPVSAAVALGQALRIGLDAGVFTGDDFDPRPSKGGRIALGAAVDVKIGKLMFHAGAGFASLLTSDEGGLYPSIGDSIYVDVNAKFAK